MKNRNLIVKLVECYFMSSCVCVCVWPPPADITSSGDIEQCLKEAAYMKDFDHPNVIQLIGNTLTHPHTCHIARGQRSDGLTDIFFCPIGVSLHRRPGQRLPIPMVVLPFMKHGDLHTFLLLSRLGESPFVREALQQHNTDCWRRFKTAKSHMW